MLALCLHAGRDERLAPLLTPPYAAFGIPGGAITVNGNIQPSSALPSMVRSTPRTATLRWLSGVPIRVTKTRRYR